MASYHFPLLEWQLIHRHLLTPCWFDDDQDGSAELPVRLAQASESPKISFTNQVKSDTFSLKEDIKTRDLKLSVNGASKGCTPLKRLTIGIAISRFGKENKTLKALPDAINNTLKSGKSRSTSARSIALTYSGRKRRPSPASRVYSSTVNAPRGQLIF